MSVSVHPKMTKWSFFGQFMKSTYFHYCYTLLNILDILTYIKLYIQLLFSYCISSLQMGWWHWCVTLGGAILLSAPITAEKPSTSWASCLHITTTRAGCWARSDGHTLNWQNTCRWDQRLLKRHLGPVVENSLNVSTHCFLIKQFWQCIAEEHVLGLECIFVSISQAERIFSEVRRIESYRVEGMEIYSTTLWHLQKDVALSALSKDLTDMDKNSPEVSQLAPGSVRHVYYSVLASCFSDVWFFSVHSPGV